MVEDKKFLEEVQPTFACGWVEARGSAIEVPPDVGRDVLVFQAPDVAGTYSSKTLWK